MATVEDGGLTSAPAEGNTCRAQEAGRYLESYKQLERKPPDMIRERVDDSYMAHLTSALTSVRGVNKTDVTTLVSNFGVRSAAESLSFVFSPDSRRIPAEGLQTDSAQTSTTLAAIVPIQIVAYRTDATATDPERLRLTPTVLLLDRPRFACCPLDSARRRRQEGPPAPRGFHSAVHAAVEE